MYSRTENFPISVFRSEKYFSVYDRQNSPSIFSAKSNETYQVNGDDEVVLLIFLLLLLLPSRLDGCSFGLRSLHLAFLCGRFGGRLLARLALLSLRLSFGPSLALLVDMTSAVSWLIPRL